MPKHLGDYDASTVIYGKFTTFRPSTGAAFTLGGTPALSVYKDGSATQSTAGVTLTADFDSVTGLNHFAIDTSADGAFYAAGSNYDVVITAGTVDSVSVVGSVVASFTIGKSALTAAEIAAAVLTTQMTESYAANGAAPTLAQGMFAIHQYLMDFTITGTAYSVKQLGGSEAFAVTLNDATTPTGATRA